MQTQHLVEEVLVSVLQGCQADMLAHRVRVEANRPVEASSLSFDIIVVRWQQSDEAESLTLFRREPRSLVE